MKTKRMISQDIAKGLAILLVILLHSVQVIKPIGAVFAILFGSLLPFFFFMSGYNYHRKDDNVFKEVKNRILGLLIPFLIFTFIIVVLMGFYFYFHDGVSIKELFDSYLVFLVSKWGIGLLGMEYNQILYQRILGPCWFIQYLIVADILFIPLSNYTRDNKKNLLITSLILTCISFIFIELGIVLPWGIQLAPCIATLMLFANYCKQNGLLIMEKINKKRTIINCIIAIIVIAVIQLQKNSIGFIAAGEIGNQLGGVDILVMYLMGIIGTYLIINISKLFEKTNKVSKVLQYYGRNTYIILIIHMSIVHILKDIFNLVQRNAADELFGNHTDPKEIVVALITIIVLPLFIKLFSYIKIGKKA